MSRSRTKSRLQRAYLDAVILGLGDQVAAMLAEGVDVDARDPEHGETALMLAANLGRDAVARLLLEHGADVNARDDRGRTPIMAARGELVAELARRVADLNAQDEYGATALMAAIEAADLDKAEWLIAHGADITKRDHDSETALTRAIAYGLVSIQTLISVAEKI